MANEETSKANKPKPPVAAQILYALGILGLIGGLLISVILFASSSAGESRDALRLLGLSSLGLKTAAVMFGIITILSFALIDQIRALKKWALISFTTLVVAGFLSTLQSYLALSAFEKALGVGGTGDFLIYFIVGPLLFILWTNNRSDFK